MRGGYGIYFNTNNQQNLIVTVTNPPATPRPVITNPTFPVPNFAGSHLDSPRAVRSREPVPAGLEPEPPARAVVRHGRSRSATPARAASTCCAAATSTSPTPIIRADGTPFWPVGPAAPEHGVHDHRAEVQRRQLVVQRAHLRGAQALERAASTAQSSYTFSRNIDTTQASTFFSDATNGTTTAFPEFPDLNYNKGLADYHAKHNWVVNFTWAAPVRAKGVRGWRDAAATAGSCPASGRCAAATL